MPITINTSVLLSAIITKIFSNHPSGWKLCYLVTLLPCLALMVGVYFAPESPRWLLRRKGRGSAERALKKLRHTTGEGWWWW